MKKKIYIEGMSCKHCVMHVETALKEIPHVNDVTVNLKGKYAEITSDVLIADSVITAVITDTGYTVVRVE